MIYEQIPHFTCLMYKLGRQLSEEYVLKAGRSSSICAYPLASMLGNYLVSWGSCYQELLQRFFGRAGIIKGIQGTCIKLVICCTRAKPQTETAGYGESCDPWWPLIQAANWSLGANPSPLWGAVVYRQWELHRSHGPFPLLSFKLSSCMSGDVVWLFWQWLFHHVHAARGVYIP